MENWRKNSRKDIVMVDVDALVPKDHLLRKIENVMDYFAFCHLLVPPFKLLFLKPAKAAFGQKKSTLI